MVYHYIFTGITTPYLLEWTLVYILGFISYFIIFEVLWVIIDKLSALFIDLSHILKSITMREHIYLYLTIVFLTI